MKKREKKICFDIWCSNGFTCSLFLRSKLVIFNNFWTCLVFPQTSGEVSGIYLKVYDGLSWDFVLDVLEKLNFSPH